MGTIVSITGFRDFPLAISGPDFRIDVNSAETWTIPSPRSVIGGNPTLEDSIYWSIASAKKVTSVPVYVAVLHDALVAPCGIVFTRANDLVYESLFPWQYENYMSQFSAYVYKSDDGSLCPKAAGDVAEVDDLFLAREGGEVGYFHFINSILPRVALSRRVFSGADVPVLVNDRRKFATDLFDLIGLNRTLPYNQWYRVKRLFLPSPFTREGDHFYRPPFGSYLLRELLGGVIPKGRGERRIYLSRSDSNVRRLTNEADLTALLKRHGFEEFVVGDMPIKEQIEFFSTVKYLVSPHGAGLSNMIFMPEGSSVLEILSPQRLWPTFRLLAARHNVGYHALIGKTYNEEQTAEKGQGNEDFWVDPKNVRMSIAQLTL